MAYITKNEVKEKAVKLKKIAKEYGIKLSVSGSNSSTITVTIQEGSIDFFHNLAQCRNARAHVARCNMDAVIRDSYLNVNHYYIDEWFSGNALECLEAIKSALLEGYWNKSDIQSDYFNTAWYIEIKIGKWNRPYNVT